MNLGAGGVGCVSSGNAEEVLHLDGTNGDRSADAGHGASANSCANPGINALAIATAQGNGTGDREVGGVDGGGGITEQDVDGIGATTCEGTTASATTEGYSHRGRFSGDGGSAIGRFGLRGRDREGRNLRTGGDVLYIGGEDVIEGVAG